MTREIEKKPYYVTMTDKFMSGWGRARDLVNKLVIGCDTAEQALIVAENADNRSDQKYINITQKKPYYSQERYLVSYHDITDYKHWFIQGYF